MERVYSKEFKLPRNFVTAFILLILVLPAMFMTIIHIYSGILNFTSGNQITGMEIYLFIIPLVFALPFIFFFSRGAYWSLKGLDLLVSQEGIFSNGKVVAFWGDIKGYSRKGNKIIIVSNQKTSYPAALISPLLVFKKWKNVKFTYHAGKKADDLERELEKVIPKINP